MDKNKYGPQTVKVEALLRRAKRLTPEQMSRLRSTWRESTEARVRIESLADALDARAKERRAAANTFGAIALAQQGWTVAWHAVSDAVLALLLEDLITEEQFSALYRPWASVMEG